MKIFNFFLSMLCLVTRILYQKKAKSLLISKISKVYKLDFRLKILIKETMSQSYKIVLINNFLINNVLTTVCLPESSSSLSLSFVPSKVAMVTNTKIILSLQIMVNVFFVC